MSYTLDQAIPGKNSHDMEIESPTEQVAVVHSFGSIAIDKEES